jgi:hypothetical protein
MRGNTEWTTALVSFDEQPYHSDRAGPLLLSRSIGLTTLLSEEVQAKSGAPAKALAACAPRTC